MRQQKYNESPSRVVRTEMYDKDSHQKGKHAPKNHNNIDKRLKTEGNDMGYDQEDIDRSKIFY